MKTSILIAGLIVAGFSALYGQTTPRDSLVNRIWGYAADARDEGRFAEALRWYESAIDLDSDNAQIFNSRGKTYFAMVISEGFPQIADSLLKLAMQDYATAISLAGSATVKAEVLINLGAAYGVQGNYQEALHAIEEGLKLDSTNVNGYLNRALVHFNLGQYEEAIMDDTQLLFYDPENTDILYERGMLQRFLHRDKEAIKDLDKVLELDPSIGLAYLERARSHAQAGHWKKAESDYEAAGKMGIKMEPQDKELMKRKRKN